MTRLEATVRRTLVLALVFAATAVPVAAQDAPGEEDPAAEAPPVQPENVEEKDGERVFRDRIVVTASRREQASAETPAPVTVIDRAEIERRQPEKMTDLFKDIPGVEVTGEGPFRGLPVIRGLSSNRVLILVDGQRLNNARESTVFAGIQPGLVDLSQVERIEVVRGPASVQYGSDALGGVINIITRQPDLGGDELEVGGSASFEYGENADSSRTFLGVSGSGRGFSFNVAGAYQEAGDYYAPSDAADDVDPSTGWGFGGAGFVDDDGRVPNSGMEQTSYEGNLRWLVGDQGVVRVTTEVVRTRDVGFPGFDPDTSGVEISFPRFDRDKLGISWQSGPVGGLENIEVSAYYQAVVKESVRNLDFGMFFSNNFTRSEIDGQGLSVQSATRAADHYMTFGLDYYRDDVHDKTLAESSFGPPSTEVAIPDSSQQGLGAWIQDDWQLSGNLKLVLGLRGDTFEFVSENDPDYAGEPFDASDSAISGNVGAVWAMTDHVDLTATVARGFRSPNLQERAFSGQVSEPGFFLIQNPDLDPESSLNYELGFKVRYDRYYGGVNVFYSDVSDLITFVELGPDPDDPRITLIRFDNVEEATIQGVEVELETLFFERWTAFTNVAYTRGDNDTENQPLGFIQPWKAVLGVRYAAPSWWAEGSARIMGRYDRPPSGDPADETPGFTVYDLRAGYDFEGGLSVQATLGNLTDKVYAEPFNNRPEPGRSFRAGVRYRF